MTRHALFLNIADNLLSSSPTPASALIQHLETVGNFQTLVRMPATDKATAPSGTDIGKALRQFLLNPGCSDQDGLIYISGAGITVEDSLGEQQGFFLPPDADSHDNNTAVGLRHGISLDSLNGLIRKSNLKRLVVLWDCNHHRFGLTPVVIEASLTAFGNKPDYCLIANTISPESSPFDFGLFSQALTHLLDPNRANEIGDDFQCDRLSQHLHHQLKGTGATLIQLGTSSLKLMNYPADTVSLPRPAPVTSPTNNNVFNISNSHLTNVSASGNINYTETGRDVSRTSKKKILMLAANPQDTDQLRLGEEAREILAGLERSKHRDRFELITRFAQRPDDMRRAMLDIEPEIIHFSGHGGASQGLVLESDNGTMQFVQTEALVRLFKFFKDTTECVLFNACYSEEQSTAIYEHIDCVVGMNAAVGDETAIKFAVGFYDALGAGRSYQDAFEMGLISINIDSLEGADIPQLKIRP